MDRRRVTAQPDHKPGRERTARLGLGSDRPPLSAPRGQHSYFPDRTAITRNGPRDSPPRFSFSTLKQLISNAPEHINSGHSCCCTRFLSHVNLFFSQVQQKGKPRALSFGEGKGLSSMYINTPLSLTTEVRSEMIH